MSALANGPGYHSRMPREQRERQMLDAAHRLFAERGFAAVTMDEIAAAVGITKPLLYNYFGNKERLYLACMQPAGDALVAAVVDAVRQTATPADALDAGMRAFFAFVAEDRDAWRVLFDETVPASGVVAQGVAEYRERLTGLVMDAIVAQLPRKPSAKARTELEAVSIAVLAAAERLGRWWLTTGAVSADRAAELLITTLAPGLRTATS